MSSNPSSFSIRMLKLPQDRLAVDALLSDATSAEFYRSDPLFPTQSSVSTYKRLFHVICLHITGVIVGLIYHVPIKSHRKRLSIIVDPEYRRQWIATEACIWATRRSFVVNQQLLRIEAVVGAEDIAGLRLMENAGYVRETVLRNYYQQNGLPRDAVAFSFVRQQLQ